MKQSRIVFALACALALALMPYALAEAAPLAEAASLAEETLTVPEAVFEAGSVCAAEDADGEALLADYVGALFAVPGRRALAPRSLGGDLEGNDALLYRILREKVAQIAAGERESAVIYVPFEDLNKTSWTAAELGVSAIIESGGISEDAKKAAIAKYAFNVTKVHEALLEDCPYELYWYDKVSGLRVEEHIGYSANSRTMTVSGSYQVSFAVAKDYAGAAEFTVDGARARSAVAAAERARTVVEQYAGMSDYARLDGYRQTICELVAYNHAAADDLSTPYGDPWQLVYVFDGDDGTDVVCEGYAKAFQYLCDLTDFRSAITCYCLTGDSIYNGSAGPHMWNAVRMPDGRNYLVDITNCDTGNVGEPDLLFLAGSTSGDVASGYTYACRNGRSITYRYDSETRNNFSAEELTMASEAYVAPPEKLDPDLVTPESLERIEASAFENAAFTAVRLTDGVTAIGARAFAGCAALTQIEIPASVTEIGADAFKGCDGLTVFCPADSAALAYARANGIDYVIDSF